MRAVLAICAMALTACAAEADVEAKMNMPEAANTVVSSEMQKVEINRELDNALDRLDAAVSNRGRVSPEDTAREYRAVHQQIGDAELSQAQQIRFDALFEQGKTDIGVIPEYRKLSSRIDRLKTVYIRGDVEESEKEQFDNQIKSLMAERDALLASAVPGTNDTTLSCHGIAKQGGLVVCQTTPNARVEVGRSENDTYTQTADKDGILLVGFDRDEPAAFVRVGDARVDFDIEKREYDTSRIDGLPKKFVSEYTAEQLKQIRKASALKKVGFASKVEDVGFKNGFIFPVTTHTKTTNFGAQRILNGDPKRPHFGVDLAAPKGTPILAPADGIVSLASEEMYFEGSLIMIDHGQGLISYYLHNETVDVEVGQRVTQGQQIGTVGSRGRSTGPHLCWRLKWRGRNLDPELLTEWPQRG